MKIPPEVRCSADAFASKAMTELVEVLRVITSDDARDQLSVAARIKTDESIRDKQHRRQGYRVINDFIGIRVITLHIGLIESASAIVYEWAISKGLRLEKRDNFFDIPAANRYRALHLDFRFLQPREVGLEDNCGLEVQITTYLQNLYGIIGHAQSYKDQHRLSGPPGDLLIPFSDKLLELDFALADILSRARRV